MTDQLSEMAPSEIVVGDDQHDELFDVLSNSRRRFALQYLQTAETPLTVGELAAELESWEGKRPVTPESGDGRDAIEISLFHHHLPKMADVGLVSFDDTRKMVALGDRTEEVRSHLRAMAAD